MMMEKNTNGNATLDGSKALFVFTFEGSSFQLMEQKQDLVSVGCDYLCSHNKPHFVSQGFQYELEVGSVEDTSKYRL